MDEWGRLAHVTRREGRVHGAPQVGARGQAARVVQGRRLAVVDGGAELHALVVAAAEELAVLGDEGGADLDGCWFYSVSTPC